LRRAINTLNQRRVDTAEPARVEYSEKCVDGRASMKFALGQAVPRTEDLSLLTGRGRDTDDFVLPRLAHVFDPGQVDRAAGDRDEAPFEVDEGRLARAIRFAEDSTLEGFEPSVPLSLTRRRLPSRPAG
jgi:hypothetical protein